MGGARDWLVRTLQHYAFDIAWVIVLCLLTALGRGLKSKGVKMLEGKEVEGKIGEFGGYSVDVDDKGMIEVAVGVKLDILAELEKIAAKTGTKIDDAVVDALKKLLGRA